MVYNEIMTLKNDLTNILKRSFKLVAHSPLLWLFFYGFVVLDLLVSNFLPSNVNKVLILLLNLVIIGLPGLKIEFLDSLDEDQKPHYKNTLKLLIYYFKKLFVVNLFFILLGGLFFVLSSVIVPWLSFVEPSIARMIVFLPLAIIYFSLFHLFIVVLVKTKKGILGSLQASVDFIKKNIKVASIIVLLSLTIHYPVSELLLALVSKLPFNMDLWVQFFLAFFNILIDLFFFAVWLILYKKKVK